LLVSLTDIFVRVPDFSYDPSSLRFDFLPDFIQSKKPPQQFLIHESVTQCLAYSKILIPFYSLISKRIQSFSFSSCLKHPSHFILY